MTFPTVFFDQRHRTPQTTRSTTPPHSTAMLIEAACSSSGEACETPKVGDCLAPAIPSPPSRGTARPRTVATMALTICLCAEMTSSSRWQGRGGKAEVFQHPVLAHRAGENRDEDWRRPTGVCAPSNSGPDGLDKSLLRGAPGTGLSAFGFYKKRTEFNLIH